MHASFLSSGIVDLLEADPRPSFIVSLTPHPPAIVYTNLAFSAYNGLLDAVAPEDGNNDSLWNWIANGRSGSTSAFPHANIYWTRSVVLEQMVVVGANEQAPSSELPRKIRLNAAARDGGSPSPTRTVIIADAVAVINPPASRPKLHPSLTTNFAALRRPTPTSATLQFTMRKNPAASDPGWMLPDLIPGMSPSMSSSPSLVSALVACSVVKPPLTRSQKNNVRFLTSSTLSTGRQPLWGP